MGVLDGKSVIVAGGGQGIGQAVAQLAAREGAQVLAVDINEEGLETTSELVQAEGGSGATQLCDVTDRAQVDDAVATAVKEHGGVDVLVNTAMVIKIAPFHLQTEADLDLAYAVMVKGVFNFMQACFPHLSKGGGSVINWGSSSGARGTPTHATYAAAKEAVRGLSKTAANEWGSHGITVNCILPVAKTPTFDSTVASMGGDERLEQIAAIHPMGRPFGDPLTDIAPVVIFLASDGGNYITGRSLFVDGGAGSFM